MDLPSTCKFAFVEKQPCMVYPMWVQRLWSVSCYSRVGAGGCGASAAGGGGGMMVVVVRVVVVAVVVAIGLHALRHGQV